MAEPGFVRVRLEWTTGEALVSRTRMVDAGAVPQVGDLVAVGDGDFADVKIVQRRWVWRDSAFDPPEVQLLGEPGLWWGADGS